MRRKQRKDIAADIPRTGDIKKDFTEKQLAAFGAVALAYNLLEDQIDALLFVVTRVPSWLFAEVSSRIHGLDGKIAIINKALDQVGLEPNDLQRMHEPISMFGEFKKNRDAMIHARIVNASIGIGLSAKQRGTADEILLSEDALGIFYDHVIALDKELFSVGTLVNGILALRLIGKDDPNKSFHEEESRVHRALFLENRTNRRLLKPMPKFPDEAELNEAENRWRASQQAALMGWFQPSPMPQLPPKSAWIGGEDLVQPILPPEEEKT